MELLDNQHSHIALPPPHAMLSPCPHVSLNYVLKNVCNIEITFGREHCHFIFIAYGWFAEYKFESKFVENYISNSWLNDE